MPQNEPDEASALDQEATAPSDHETSSGETDSAGARGPGIRTRRDRVRSIIAGLTGVVGVLAILVGGSGLWALWVAFDSDRFERRVDEILAVPEVGDAIAARVVDEVSEAIGVRDAVIDLLPGALEPAADLVLAGARTFVVDRVSDALRRDEVRSLIAGAAGRAHAGAVEVIRGGSLVDGLRVVEDEVRLDLFPLVGLALERLQGLGLFSGVELPDLTRELGAEANRSALGVALDRDLSPEFGELVVFRSEVLEQAGATIDVVQRWLTLSARLSAFALVLGAAASVAAVVLARRRVRAAGLIAVAIALEVVLVQVITQRAANRAPTLVENLAGQIAISQLIDDLQRSLVRTTALIGVALIVLLSAILVGIARGRPGQGDPDAVVP